MNSSRLGLVDENFDDYRRSDGSIFPEQLCCRLYCLGLFLVYYSCLPAFPVDFGF
ncbi:hypothetical protein D3C74_263570 [compost metagenome]